MNNNRFTAGPWQIAETVQNKFAPTDMRRVRAINEGLEHGAVCEVYGIRDGSVAEANALLIAAAPELYDALASLLGAVTGGRVMLTNYPEVDAAFAALKKARGA